MKTAELFEAKSKVFLVVKLELEYVNSKDDTKRKNTTLVVNCKDEQEAEAVKAKLDDVNWSEDHDDLLHHIGSNGFNDFEHGYVDAIPMSSKITTVEPKLTRTTFHASASDF
jgi:hypothetical protein